MSVFPKRPPGPLAAAKAGNRSSAPSQLDARSPTGRASFQRPQSPARDWIPASGRALGATYQRQKIGGEQ